jgi:hypothetical protein
MATQLWLSDGWKPSLFSLREFIRRNDRLITLCGALLVFLTFVTKDVLHERWKDLADAIEAAESAGIVRKDIQTSTHLLVGKIGSTEEGVDILLDNYVAEANRALNKKRYSQKKTHHVDFQPPGLELADQWHSEMALMIWYNRRTLSLIDPLLEVAGTESERTTRNKLDHDLDDFFTTCFMGDGEVSDCFETETKLSSKCDAFDRSTRATVVEICSSYRHRADLFGWISVGTYTLGWGLAILASLCGARVDIPDS